MSLLRNSFRILAHCDYLRFGLRDRLVRAIHHPDTAPSEEFNVAFFGKSYPGNFNTFIDWSVYYFGAYSKNELILMRDFLELTKDPNVVDIGANVGHHTLFAATVAKRVDSFEPYKLVCDKLHQKIEVNNLTNVKIHEVALGEETEIKRFYPPVTANTSTGSFENQGGVNQQDHFIELPIHRGDEYFENHVNHQIDFVKIDVEGFEVAVLKGLRKVFKSSRPVCFFEWSQLERGSNDGRELFPADYSFFEFEHNRPVMTFFTAGHYHLKPLKGNWPDTNLVAVPNEYIKRAITDFPDSDVSKRLQGR